MQQKLALGEKRVVFLAPDAGEIKRESLVAVPGIEPGFSG
jgi:hypothetical protein